MKLLRVRVEPCCTITEVRELEIEKETFVPPSPAQKIYSVNVVKQPSCSST